MARKKSTEEKTAAEEPAKPKAFYVAKGGSEYVTLPDGREIQVPGRCAVYGEQKPNGFDYRIVYEGPAPSKTELYEEKA